MRKFLPLAILLQSLSLLTYAQNKVKPDVIYGKLERISAPVKNYESFTKTEPGIFKSEVLNEKNVEHVFKYQDNKLHEDPALQKSRQPNTPQSGVTGQSGDFGLNESTVIKSWDGNNSSQVSPLDPTMGAGPNHIVQLVNTSGGSNLKIWDKSGTVLLNTVLLKNIHGIAGAAGDPIVQYDKLADRWLLSEFTSTVPYKLVILVSKTNDPTGQYYVYSFSFGVNFLDYPKYSVWPNAYYATANIFPNLGAYAGSTIMAFNRAKMLAGDPTAELIKFDINDASSKYYSNSPVTYQAGTAPAANAPGMFTYLSPDEWTAAVDVDSVGIITLSPDFVTPASSSYSFTGLPTAAYNAQVGVAAPQPGTALTLQTLDQRIMNQPVYRDFGTYKSIYIAQTVGIPTPTRAAIRWYELRNTGSGYSIYQQGTFSPDNAFRYMPSISVNGKAEIAIAYMTSSSTVFPSLKFAGRKPTDPLGTLTAYEETTIIDGKVSQVLNNRAGDYSQLQVDPVDDTTFWFTGHYHASPNIFGGYSRIANLDLAEPLPWDAKMISINNPVNGAAFCSSTVVPNITFKNSGLNTITSLTITAKIDNNPAVVNSWSGSLPLGSTATLDLASLTALPGTHTLTVYTSLPNGNADMVPANDTAKITFTVLSPLLGPIVEGFESPTFPPIGWRVLNPNAGSITWQRSTAASKSGIASAWINLWNYTTVGHLDYLVSPILDAIDFDTVQVSFERAYRKYNASTTTFNDTLLIQISTDCGTTFPITAWKKGGVDLTTNPTTTTASYTPVAADWLNEKVDLKPFLPAGTTSFTVSFTTKNGFGQNLFLDNVNINVSKLRRRDATISKIIDPFIRLCGRTVTPLVEFGNKGIDTLKKVKLVYTVNNVLTDSVIWTGNLASGQFLTQAFKSLTLPAAGNYVFKFYTSRPNDSTDQYTANDTLSVSVTVFDPIPGPVKEGFEQTTFPPANWAINSSNNKYKWERTTLASSEGVASAWIRNRVYNGSGAKDELYAPLIQLSNVDSVFLVFDVAHVTARYPGSTAVPLDTLEVLLTKDCGKTFTSVYKKWGEDLQTVNDPNFPVTYPPADTIGFVPKTRNQWRTDSVNITPLTGANGSFQLVFRNINNNGNNIFLDNINIRPLTLPAKLKRQGYMISPNPSEGWVYVRHYLHPTDLRGLQVINSNGQTIWQQQYTGNALSNIPVDINRFPAGIYTFRLIYTNKVIVERVVKAK
jgi:hypothetical protein